jgi:hypothetical protein
MRISALLLSLCLIAVPALLSAQSKPYKLKIKGDKVVLVDRTEGHQFVRAELEQTFAERARVVRNRDAEGQIAQVSPDYLGQKIDGSPLTYEGLVEYMRAGTVQWVEALSVNFTIDGFTLDGKVATVDARQHHTRTQRLADGQVHLVETGVLQREVWVRTALGWKLRSTDNFRERFVKVDGRLVDGG